MTLHKRLGGLGLRIKHLTRVTRGMSVSVTGVTETQYVSRGSFFVFLLVAV